METKELVETLLGAFKEVPDPRSSRGRRHRLGAILVLSVAAMLGGARSLYGIRQWGRVQDAEVVRGLGFTREQTPGVATLHRVFKRLAWCWRKRACSLDCPIRCAQSLP